MQNVMIEPLVKAPANAQTRTAATGCVEPNTAPNSPVTIAKTVRLWFTNSLSLSFVVVVYCMPMAETVMEKKNSSIK